MEARQLLAVLRRRAWFIARCALALGVVVGVLSYLRTPNYEATAQVLLRPNDPTESLDQTNVQPITGIDTARYVNSQADIAQSPAVAAAAAPDVPGGMSAGDLLTHVSVGADANSYVLSIHGESTDPAQATAIADAFAHKYIDNRREFAVANLQSALDDIARQLRSLQQQIARYDVQIAAQGSSGATSGAPATGITAPTDPASSNAPTVPSSAPTAPVDPNATPATAHQDLLAARYAAEVQYQTLFAKQQDLSVDKSLKRGEAELVSDAKTPSSPVSPKPFRDAVLGGVFGLLLGMGIAFTREQLDDKVKTAEELEELTGTPVLARAPIDSELADHPMTLAASAHPLGRFAESMRSLRTSLQFMGVDDPVRSVLVTSAVPGDGKTAIAANLAVVYAQAGFETVLVSADMRRPRVDAMFAEVDLSRGLSGMLTQLAAAHRRRCNGADPHVDVDPTVVEAVLREHMVETSIEHLAVLPAGLRAPNPAEVLGSRWMREVMAYLERTADVIIVDSSPALAVTDAVVLSTLVDGVVVVVPSGDISRNDVQRVVKTFASVDARVLGTVLNRCSDVGSQYYYGYQASVTKPPRRRRVGTSHAESSPDGAPEFESVSRGSR